MTSNEPSNQNKFLKVVPWIEKLFLITSLIGSLLYFLDFEASNDLLVVSLAILTIALFISAFNPPEIFQSESEAKEHGPLGMLDLLSLVIAPKVLWIGSAISCFALLAYVANFPNQGYIKLGTIGATSIITALIVLFVALVSGIKNIKVVFPIFLRAIGFLIVDYYLVVAI